MKLSGCGGQYAWLSRLRSVAWAPGKGYPEFAGVVVGRTCLGHLSRVGRLVLPAPNPPEMTIFVEAAPHPSECS